MIGILGGTFDPIHYGHLRPAHEVQQALALAQVRLIPAGEPPHRVAPAASAQQRLQMVQRAVAEYPNFVVDDRELLRAGPSYTVETLESLRTEYSEQTLCLIMGIDAFLDLESWHQSRRIPEMAHIVVVTRLSVPGNSIDGSALPEWTAGRLTPDPQALVESKFGRIYITRVTPQAISASKIRSAIADGESVQDWIPPAVWSYIQAERLYGYRGS
jgi:nicotinate-nucleotide adenylyltransferase